MGVVNIPKVSVVDLLLCAVKVQTELFMLFEREDAPSYVTDLSLITRMPRGGDLIFFEISPFRPRMRLLCTIRESMDNVLRD